MRGTQQADLAATATLCLLCYLAGPADANAQTGEAPIDTALALDTIIVDVERKPEDQQRVPSSITTADKDFLDDNNIRTLQDLTAAVPGLVATNSVNYGAAPLSIRGVGGVNGGANLFADEPVSVYVDDVYLARLSFSTSDLVDIENVQIVRGPQGTLFGRNATAGAILVSTADPTPELSSYVEASYTDLGEYRLAGALSGPIAGETLLGRLAVGYSDRAGFGTNTVTGQRAGGSEDLTLRGKLQLQASDRLKLIASLEFQERDAVPATLQLSDLFSGPGNPLLVRPRLQSIIEANKFSYDGANFLRSDAVTASLTGTYDLGWAELTAITAYRAYNFRGAQDSDGTGADLFRNQGRSENEQFTQELRLAADGPDPLSWIGGVFFIHEDNALNPFIVDNVSGLFGLGTRAEFNAFNQLDSWSAFVDVTYRLNDHWAVTGGLRYTDESKSFNNAFALSVLNGGTIPAISAAGPLVGLTLPAGTPFPPGAQPETLFADDASFENLSPRIVLEYQASDSLLLYGSNSQGFKSGGFNSFGLTPAFQPETIEAYELGVKSEWLRGQLRINASAFHYDYSNLQVRIGVSTGGVDIQNAATAKVRGAELEFAARPFESLKLDGSLAFLDADFTGGRLPAVPADQLFLIGAPVALELQPIVGNRLSRAPDWQAYLAAEYSRRLLRWGTLSIRGDVRAQSEVYFLEVNQGNNTFRGDGFVEYGLRASLTSPDDRVTYSLFGRNLTDARYVTQVTQLGTFPNGATNEPLKWGVGIKARF
ncbi:TonB-dependent receptor [Henriciella sp.]|uniref:TonB-dependent receptor n=1 Tax=Henriciella sp. TaxID=1968823 RepID=UPI00260B0150|nr:TonB-dependent receptor [Henriciella sp.]